MDVKNVLATNPLRPTYRDRPGLETGSAPPLTWRSFDGGLVEVGFEGIDVPLLVTNRKGGERHVVVSARGKPAETRVSLSRTYGVYSLLQCAPRTGRTHQIRVHLQHAGHPILGDERYGDADANTQAHELGLERLFLHAQSIAFADDSGNDLHFTAPLADDLERFLNVGVIEAQRRKRR